MLLAQFIFLQVMDALTTLLFLHIGVGEANPLIRTALSAFGSTLSGQGFALAVPKLLAIGLGFYAWRSGRRGLLRKMNLLFALCVCWNVAVMAAGSA